MENAYSMKNCTDQKLSGAITNPTFHLSRNCFLNYRLHESQP